MNFMLGVDPRSPVEDVQAGMTEDAKKAVKEIKALVADYSELVAEYARFLCPLDTGDLMSTIEVRISPDELTGTIKAGKGTSRPYAAWVEHGTVKTPPQPFMVPAAEQGEADFRNKGLAIIKRTL